MEFTIQKGNLCAKIKQKGAELCSFTRDGREHVWQADPKIWGNHGPLLFPIVGRTKDNRLNIGGQDCAIPTHGFLSQLSFTVETQGEDFVTLVTTETAETLTQYPFSFRVTATYSLAGDTLRGAYTIENTNARTMPYGFGLHNGFYCLESEREPIEDVYLQFDHPITASKPTRSADNFMDFNQPIPVMHEETQLWLKNEWYPQKAPAMADITFHNFDLCHRERGVILSYAFSENFELFNAWRQFNSSFLCLEPWSSQCGVYPCAKTLEEVPNTKLLAQGETHEYWFTVTLPRA